MDQESRKQADRDIRDAMARLLVAARKTAPSSPPQATSTPPAPVEIAAPVPEPGAAGRKVPVSIRLDADLLAALRGTGQGWQSRANAMLRAAMGLGDGGKKAE